MVDVYQIFGWKTKQSSILVDFGTSIDCSKGRLVIALPSRDCVRINGNIYYAYYTTCTS